MIAPGKHRSVAGRVLAVGFLLAALLIAGCFLLPARPAFADTITVTNTADPGDGICNASGCTLREAIKKANGTGSKDAIHFDIAGGTGVKTIKPKSQLPQITWPVTIDGYTQSGASKNTLDQGTNAVLKIELNGEDAEPYPQQGLKIRASNSTVTGLVINRFGSNGIDVGGAGVDPQGNRVVGNFIGTDPSGTLDRGNDGRGVVIYEEDTSANTVGGSRPAARNLISGNGAGGVGIFLLATDNAVLGNLIGTEKNGTDALGNSGEGVRIGGPASDNLVGSTLSGGANTIAFNGDDGVRIIDESSTGNGILRNAIYSNEGLGINLDDDGATANDTDDGDIGPNNLQNKPNLTSARNGGGKTTVKGSLNSVPNRTFNVRFFSNPSGNEGKKYIGAKHVTTDANGNTGSFTFKPENKVGANQTITATATRLLAGDTSEFSNSEAVVAN
jgi:CSLREA domain-containing protein